MRSLLMESLEDRTLFAGVTMFVPAWNGGLNGWIATQAAAITTQLGGPSQVPEYTLTVAPTTPGGPLAASIAHTAGTATPQTGGSGQIILILDYTSVSTDPSYPLSNVAKVATQFLENNSVDGINLLSLPMHEISISRGTGEEDEFAKALAQNGIWIEQETYLDPHIVSEIGDAPNAVYGNVEFADEYWRTSGDANPVAPEVNSYPVAGAYQSNVQSVQDDRAGNGFVHLSVGGYYTGTIDQNATQGGDGAIDSDWYGDGYPDRNQTGFYYSAIDGGTRPLSGVWAASGGTGVRTPVATSGTQWPNISDVSSIGGSYDAIGKNLAIHYIQQDSTTASTITFYLDNDADPYNTNVAATLGTVQVAPSGSIFSGTFNASTAGLTAGTYYIGAKIDDGQGHVRWSYSQPITLTQPGGTIVQLAGTPIGTAGSYNNTGNTIANVFDGNLNTYFDGPSASGNWAGLDLGSPQSLTSISYAPRVGFEIRMVGGSFQASNDPTFTTGVVTLATISTQPADGLTSLPISISGAYRYVRYLAPAGSYGDIAEMQVFGIGSGGVVSSQPPTQPGTPSLTAPASSYGVSLAWAASTSPAGVNHYNVFRNNALLASVTGTSYTDLTAAAGAAYSYTITAVDAAGNTSTPSAALLVNTAPPIVLLSGTPIGTPGSYANDGQTIANVFDGNLATFFDGPDASGDWVGLDLGAQYNIDRIVFAPRESTAGSFPFESRMVGGVFQASNDPTFATGVVTLATITTTPLDGWQGLEATNPGTYRYVRFVSPTNGYCNVADLEFLGTPAIAPTPTQPDLTPPTATLATAASITAAASSAYTFTVTYADNVAINAATLGNNNIVVSNGSGYNQTATLVSTGLSNGASVVATYSVPAPSGGWVYAADGTYSIALQSNQVADTSGNYAAAATLGSFTVNIPAPLPGTLSGAQTTAAASYSLTTLGTTDWAHWGRNGTYANFDHKAAGKSQISNVTVVGAGASVGGYAQPSRSVNWTDGAPTASDSGDSGYIWENGATGTGFSFTVPASTTPETLYVYAGGYGTQSTLTAHLSDGSAADYVATASGSGLYTNLYTINFKAGSAGQTLTITLLKTGSIVNGGSVDLIAAALAGPDTTPPAAALTAGPALTTASTSPYTFTVTYTDNAAVNAATLGNSNITVSNGSGYNQTATLVSTGLTNGPTVVATYSVPAPTGGWTNASNGTYTIALAASQIADTSGNFAAAGKVGSFSVNIPVPTPPGTGSLAGTQVTAAAAYNLTTLGTTDWAHWGVNGNYATTDRKAAGGSQISAITTLGGVGSNVGGYTQSARSTVWTDGAPTTSSTGDHGYIWSNGVLNSGFSFTVPAGTTAHTLYIYAGGYGTTSSLTAHLSDGSAPDYTVTASGSGLYTNFYTITFKAASAGQTLTIMLIKTASLVNGGSVDLIGAALA
jgi:hypothetical protein